MTYFADYRSLTNFGPYLFPRVRQYSLLFLLPAETSASDIQSNHTCTSLLLLARLRSYPTESFIRLPGPVSHVPGLATLGMGCSNYQDCVHDTPNQIGAPKVRHYLVKAGRMLRFWLQLPAVVLCSRAFLPLFASTLVTIGFNFSTTVLLLRSDPSPSYHSLHNHN